MPVGLLGQECRRREDGERSRRVLDEEVAIGDPPVQEGSGVLAVEAEVAILAAAG
jgi:hypothetical protein